MSVLIKGMEMPKTCHCCRMCVQVSDGDIDWHWECCLLCEKVARYATDRIPGCPLVPVPPHGDLIDREETKRRLAEHLCKMKPPIMWPDWNDAVITICTAPTIIPAEEVNNRDLS